MSQYPPETIRRLDAQADAWDHAEHMRSTHIELFEDAVISGADIELLFPYGNERKTYPVSVYLSEPPSKAQPFLFKACHEVMAGRDPTAALRSFVEHVAADYADACVERWGVQ